MHKADHIQILFKPTSEKHQIFQKAKHMNKPDIRMWIVAPPIPVFRILSMNPENFPGETKKKLLCFNKKTVQLFEITWNINNKFFFA